MSIRVLLADDHTILRQGLAALLNSQGDMEVVAEAADGRAACELTGQLAPDVVIMDLSMPDLNGVEAARRIVDNHPSCRVLMLSMYSDKRFVARALSAGASGYLLKDCVDEELVRAIRAVVEGRTYLSPDIAGAVVGDYVSGNSASGQATDLTPREKEVLQLLAEGHSTKQIATELGISPKTVETHRQRTMDKLDIHSVAELTKYAIREGLTSADS